MNAASTEQLDAIRELFNEYGLSLGFHICFEKFEEEMAGLPGDYAPPRGCLLLALYDGTLAGCLALRPLEAAIAEMKRMYVRPEFRGKGLGRALADAVLSQARALGYERVRLDTLPAEMQAAVAMYRALGFREIPPYRDNPPAALHMELRL